MKEFVEMRILGAVRELLTGRVNEILLDDEFDVPIIEFGNCQDGGSVSPMIALSSCEKNVKERIIRLDAYLLTVTFSLADKFESESHCYAYCSAVCTALKENPTMGGVVDRTVVVGEKYVPPKVRNCNQSWEVVLTLRVTVEEIYCSRRPWRQENN